MVNYPQSKKGENNGLSILFSALANARRRQIVHFLSLQPATIKTLAISQSMSLPAIHKHIIVLEQAQLISRKKVGRTNFVALNHNSLNAVRDWALQYRTEWANDSQTLENYIASMRD